MTYLLDSNVFIQAKNEYYAFDIVPAFWDWLVEANSRGTLFSITHVRDELIDYQDELSAWAKARDQASGFFLEADDDVLARLREVAHWATTLNFTDAAVNEFLDSADYQLVAHALAHGQTVVTQEVYEPAITRKIKIPNACQGLGITWMNTYTLLRTEGATF